ncbi:MAG: hypothetical protein ABIK15_10060 [Pseudomonadota bacterium]
MKLREKAQKARVLPEYFLCEMDSISDTCLTLSTLLYSRGLEQDKVYQLVSDVIRVVDSTCFCNLSYVNHALESLGWPSRILDETSFELIKEILFSVFEYQVEVVTVH